MIGSPILLNHDQRDLVASVIREHSNIRGWMLHAVSVRSNHVHVVVSAKATPPKQVRDQLKANGTRVLRIGTQPLTNERVWTKGGDIEFIDTDKDLERAVQYVVQAQDRVDRGE